MRNILRRRKEERGKRLRKAGMDYASLMKQEKIAALRKDLAEINTRRKLNLEPMFIDEVRKEEGAA